MRRSNIHTLTETTTDTTSEEVRMPASNFIAIMNGNREKLDMLEIENINLQCDLRAAAEIEKEYKDALKKFQQENSKLKNFIDSKSKVYTKEDMHRFKNILDEKSEYFLKNKEKLIQDAYNKKHASRIASLRDDLNKSFISSNLIDGGHVLGK